MRKLLLQVLYRFLGIRPLTFLDYWTGILFLPEYVQTITYVLPAYVQAKPLEVRQALLSLCNRRFRLLRMKYTTIWLGSAHPEPEKFERVKNKLSEELHTIDGLLTGLYRP